MSNTFSINPVILYIYVDYLPHCVHVWSVRCRVQIFPLKTHVFAFHQNSKHCKLETSSKLEDKRILNLPHKSSEMSGLRRSSRRTANASSVADSDPDLDGLDLVGAQNVGLLPQPLRLFLMLISLHFT